MSQEQAPKLFIRFFLWYCNPKLQEAILGDLLEQFDDDLHEYGSLKAKKRFIWNVFRFFRPGITKSLFGSQKLNIFGMFKHNILISFRSFKRYKTTFLINLIGLSSGIAAVFLIYLWIEHEQSVDKFNANDDNLYRVMTHFQLPDEKITWEYTAGPLAKSLVEKYPEVINSTRVNNKYFIPKGVVSAGEHNQEVTGQFADPNVFSIIDYKLISGKQEQVILDKNSVVLSKELAEKLFKDYESAIGQTLDWDCDFFHKSFLISGIFEAPPKSATRQFDLMINYQNLIDVDDQADDWRGGYAETFIVLKEDTNVSDFESKIANHYDDKLGNQKFTVFLQKYSDWYLNGQFEDGKLVGGRIANVRLFRYIGIFIVIIAIINFINLSTAQATTKLKEIGVKKAMGGQKSNLIFQFLTESILMTTLSMIAALGIIYGLLPYFSTLIGVSLEFNIIQYIPHIFLSIVGLGIIAGIYPSIYLSSFKAISIMRGKLPSLKGEVWMRKGLVITQFSLSVIFVVGMITVNSQLSFIENKPLGYNRDNLLTFEGKGSEQVSPKVFVPELQQIPGVINATSMAGTFLWGNDTGSGFTWGNDPSTRNYLFKSPKISYNTIETLELEIVAGRSFDPAFNDNHHRIIINESAVKMMGLSNPIGHKLDYSDNESKEIIGVVKDFQYGSLHQPIEPLIFRFRNYAYNYMVRIAPGQEYQTIDAIEKKYSEFFPKYNFDSQFLDDEYEALYIAEQRVGSLSGYAAFLAIIVSSLGLLGLITFTTERRIKEIGIRKVLGCSSKKLVFILSWDFTKMVLIAIVIAIPLSYLGVKEWLQNFAYHIELSWWYFGLGGLIALLMAWLIIGTKTVKAATSNPVESLKYE